MKREGWFGNKDGETELPRPWEVAQKKGPRDFQKWRWATIFCKSSRTGLDHYDDCQRYSILPLLFREALLSVFSAHPSVSCGFLR